MFTCSDLAGKQMNATSHLNTPHLSSADSHTPTLFKNASWKNENSTSLDNGSDICQISLENINILQSNVCGLKCDFDKYPKI